MKHTARIQHSLESIPHLDIEKTVETFIKTKKRFILLDYNMLDLMPSKKEANPVSHLTLFEIESKCSPYLASSS